jgi:adenylate cyclase
MTELPGPGEYTMAAVLRVMIEGEERDFPCGELVTIGRDKKSDISLFDLKVSRNHAIVRQLGDGRHYVIDSGSANGTLLNDKRVLVPVPLRNGDQLLIGDHVLTFVCDAARSDPAEGEEGIQATLVSVGNVVQQVTILVCDVRNYTPMSEKMGVDALATVMWRWFKAASEIVERHGGVVDKYLGDAVMVRWVSGRKKVADPVLSALRTSVELSRAAVEINGQFPDLPFPFRVGVGINSGEAVLGTLGSGGSREYTALGDAVNIAFRLEKATKTLGKDVVVGPDSCQGLPSSLCEGRQISVEVKGKGQSLMVCAFTFQELETRLADMASPVA